MDKFKKKKKMKIYFLGDRYNELEKHCLIKNLEMFLPWKVQQISYDILFFPPPANLEKFPNKVYRVVVAEYKFFNYFSFQVNADGK